MIVIKKKRWLQIGIACLILVTLISADQRGCDGQEPVKSAESEGVGCAKYPVVLAHGFSGWDVILGYEYFFRVKEYLEQLGCKVFVTQVDAFNTIEVRGTQLTEQILAILEETGAEKVNIIGHSMGGLDGRYAITHGGIGDKVAALVTISTPHQGTSIADIALGLMESTHTDEMVDFILSLAGCTMKDGIEFDECKQSALDATWNLTTEYVQNEFNPNTPDDPNVSYFSYAGITGVHSSDIVDPLLALPYSIIYEIEGDNDGLCSVTSAQWGEFIGTVDADHLDEIGQIAGVTVGFDYLRFYRNIVLMLRDRGF